ncbi:MAG: hypothetical protein HYV07_05840 [Deltaproteobacteria bacterium]|nr:hypothetical protein [Deltaproteobacteria bacterium]
MSLRLARYHVHLFEWHSRTFHPFDEVLSDLELDYLDASFHMADKADERPRTGYRHFSYYTYSHRVAGTGVNSTRLAYGTLSKPKQLWPKAKLVIEERGLDLERALPRHEDLGFYGLGWDLAAAQLKVYFRVPDVLALPGSYADLLTLRPAVHRAEGLVSASFVGPEMVERKVYFYPLGDDTEDRSLRTVLMSTTARGRIAQLDVPGSDAWRSELSPPGQHIVDLYASIGESLDTIAFDDPDHFTLYFP